MPIQDIINQCSPTLAGLKTGSLFSARMKSRRQINEEIHDLNMILHKKGLRAVPLRYMKDKVLIYIYRPDRLEEDLRQADAEAILKEQGYTTGHAGLCLVQLIRRLRDENGFPHEIGLFLSYPPSDVRCFMEDPCHGMQCVGCWKAYSNKEEAERTFMKYKKCTEIYAKRIREGRSLEQLIV